MKSLFHGTGSVPMDVGHLPLLARLSGTLCPRTCGIPMFLRTVTGSHWRRFYFRSTSVLSALEVFYENALYKFTFHIWHWHLTQSSQLADVNKTKHKYKLTTMQKPNNNAKILFNICTNWTSEHDEIKARFTLLLCSHVIQDRNGSRLCFSMRH